MEDSHERPRLILVSASPRRRELIASLTAHFEVAHSTVEEEGAILPHRVTPLPPLPLPAPYTVPLDSDARLWAWRKAVDYADRNPRTPDASVLVITHICEEGARPAPVWYKEDTKHSRDQQEAEQCSV